MTFDVSNQSSFAALEIRQTSWHFLFHPSHANLCGHEMKISYRLIGVQA